MLEQEFVGKTVVVTGGVRGIGRAISEAFLERGARVVALYRNLPRSDSAIGDLSSRYKEFFPIQCDVSQMPHTQAARVLAMIQSDLHVLVNNAGIVKRGPLVEMSDEDMSVVFETNVMGMVRVVRLLRPRLLVGDAAKKSIVNISSTRAYPQYAIPGSGIYGASKAAVLALTATMAHELAPIRVNSVSPCRTKTDMLSDVVRQAEILDLNEPRDVAELVVFLASERARNITGQDFVVGSDLQALYCRRG